MPRIGITGHIGLSSATAEMVSDALRRELRSYPEPHGITCLARGADQLFARAVIAVGGTFEVILPAPDYRDAVLAVEHRREFDDLLTRATSVTRMPFVESSPVAYRAANQELLRRSALLFAVWDGTRSGRIGETGEVVGEARARRVPVHVVWPANSHRVPVPA
ncbi:MAG TPA: hypothetical protein VHZ97_08635 [Pseudonocardiaceae bacterium]|jgi:hypothetical protein|nr:hypothetical protein [Pseudonocardiaceae bacterium]